MSHTYITHLFLFFRMCDEWLGVYSSITINQVQVRSSFVWFCFFNVTKRIYNHISYAYQCFRSDFRTYDGKILIGQSTVTIETGINKILGTHTYTHALRSFCILLKKQKTKKATIMNIHLEFSVFGIRYSFYFELSWTFFPKFYWSLFFSCLQI